MSEQDTDPRRDLPGRAAVLAPLFSRDGVSHLVFIQRSHTVRFHQGEIAFPGGRHQPEEDESLFATALREAEEELGLHSADVELLLALPEVRTLTSNFLIAPFVGRIPHPYQFTPDAREVAAVLTISLPQLRASGARRIVARRLNSGLEFEAPAFMIGKHVIWGATQRITEELLRVLP